MTTSYKGPNFTSIYKNQLNTVVAGDFTSIPLLSAQNIAFTSATLSGDAVFTDTGLFLTLNINGSALYLPLYN